MSTLTESIVRKVEELRRERTDRHDSLVQEIDAHLASQSLESASLLSALEDALTEVATHRLKKTKEAAVRETRMEKEKLLMDDSVKMDDDDIDTQRGGSAPPRRSTSIPLTRTPAKKRGSMDVGEAIEKAADIVGEQDVRFNGSMATMIELSQEERLKVEEVKSIAKKLADVEDTIKLVSNRRIRLRSQFLLDLRRLDTLEAQLTSTSRAYETEPFAFPSQRKLDDIDDVDPKKDTSVVRRLKTAAVGVVGVGVAVGAVGYIAMGMGLGI
ncbi:hypothetical protein BC829DRAFT_403343 [Chytridium lagenaria]|nr:hypothetical protein BC829DRAFT_403343 [Chytridium lagenaria]